MTDPYARSEYRRMVAWESRIKREGPFLTQALERAPERSVLDVGCGTGEHTAFFARLGARSVGIDRSEEMLAQAKDHEARSEGRFLLGDVTCAPELRKERPFGLAICLGNMLPHITEEATLEALLGTVHDALLPQGLLVLQILNYQRILDQGIRHLPVNFREGEGEEEVVFLRLIKPVSSERILFFPTTLVVDAEGSEPVSVRRTRRVELRPWTAAQLVPVFAGAGFQVELYGDLHGGDFLDQESHDLVMVAVRG
jgi:SAM-dependent methyltransferase